MGSENRLSHLYDGKQLSYLYDRTQSDLTSVMNYAKHCNSIVL